MASQRQIAANRLNSQKSTGPHSVAGKSVSRMNALKSGMHAESHVIRGEDRDSLARLAAEYNAEFRPVTPRQRDLVDTLVRNEWKIRRLERIETELWEGEFDSDDCRSFDPNDRNHLRNRKLPLRSAFFGLEDRLERLQRRLHAYERSTTRALRQLRDLVEVAPLTDSAEEHPQVVETSAPPPQIGFVSSNTEAAPPEDRAQLSGEPASPAALTPDPTTLTPVQPLLG